MSSLPSPKLLPFFTPTEHDCYRIFPHGTESDSEMWFHGTSAYFFASIQRSWRFSSMREQLSIPPLNEIVSRCPTSHAKQLAQFTDESLESISFARNSGIALSYACRSNSDSRLLSFLKDIVKGVPAGSIEEKAISKICLGISGSHGVVFGVRIPPSLTAAGARVSGDVLHLDNLAGNYAIESFIEIPSGFQCV